MILENYRYVQEIRQAALHLITESNAENIIFNGRMNEQESSRIEVDEGVTLIIAVYLMD